VTAKQRSPLQSRAERTRQQMQRGATGGLGYGARVGQTISGALGRGAGGQFVRVAERETIRERNERLRAILAEIRALLRTPGVTPAGSKRARSPVAGRRLNVLAELATNRQAMVERIVQSGYASREAATVFLAFIDGEALSDEQQAVLVRAGLLDETGNLTRAGRRLKVAYARNNVRQARQAIDLTGPAEKSKLIFKAGQNDYQRAIRNAVRGLWIGEFDYDQFFDAMSTAIEFHIPQAWYSGARDCGVQPNELTADEKAEIKRNIQYEKRWIEGYATAIEENSRANGGKLTPLFTRAKIWIGRYEGIRSQARAMACGNKKLKWVKGPTASSCRSCTKLDGKVKRASYWYERGILPRVHGAEYLECHGFFCLCELVPTDEPISKGPLPSLP
jgi:hypothetical protein